MNEHGRGRRVERVVVRDAQVIRGTSGRAFDRTLRGKRFQSPTRHGKWLIAPLSRSGSPAVLMHFGMTGSLHWTRTNADIHRHDRVIFRLEGGELHYRDMRKLTGLRLARSEKDVDRVLGELGPDALEVSREDFRAAVCLKRRKLKALLTDQTVIAGLGNLLVDELLWRARVRPQRSASDLSQAECDRVRARMRSVLRAAIPTGRVPPRRSWLTGRRDDADARCPRCDRRLARDRVGGRTTVWCPDCQS